MALPPPPPTPAAAGPPAPRKSCRPESQQWRLGLRRQINSVYIGLTAMDLGKRTQPIKTSGLNRGFGLSDHLEAAESNDEGGGKSRYSGTKLDRKQLYNETIRTWWWRFNRDY